MQETKRAILSFLIALKREGQPSPATAPRQGQHPAELLRHRHGFHRLHGRPNPYKQGHFLPGTHIPIRAPEKISRRTKPDYVLILPWNLQERDHRAARLHPRLGRAVCGPRPGDASARLSPRSGTTPVTPWGVVRGCRYTPVAPPGYHDDGRSRTSVYVAALSRRRSTGAINRVTTDPANRSAPAEPAHRAIARERLPPPEPVPSQRSGIPVVSIATSRPKRPPTAARVRDGIKERCRGASTWVHRAPNIRYWSASGLGTATARTPPGASASAAASSTGTGSGRCSSTCHIAMTSNGAWSRSAAAGSAVSWTSMPMTSREEPAAIWVHLNRAGVVAGVAGAGQRRRRSPVRLDQPPREERPARADRACSGPTPRLSMSSSRLRGQRVVLVPGSTGRGPAGPETARGFGIAWHRR